MPSSSISPAVDRGAVRYDDRFGKNGEQSEDEEKSGSEDEESEFSLNNESNDSDGDDYDDEDFRWDDDAHMKELQKGAEEEQESDEAVALREKPVLTPAEIFEVRAILMVAMERLALISSITMDANEQAEDLTRSVGDEISRVMMEQKELEKRFEALIQARAILKTMPNKAKLAENGEELHAVAGQLRETTKILCRNLKDNPNVADNMNKIAQERSKLFNLLQKTHDEVLETGGRFPTLVATVEEEETYERKILETVESEKALSQQVRMLRHQIKDERSAHDDEMRARARSLSLLKEELKDLKQKTSMETKYKAMEAAAAASCATRVRNSKLREMEDEIERLRALNEIEKKVHEETTDFLKRKNVMLREEAIKWASKHEFDVQKLDRDIEDLREAKQRDFGLLQEFEARFRKEAGERKAKEDEERRHAEDLILRQGEIEVSTKAAIKIQALYRGWHVRFEMAGGKKKKKGKKGKKGKGGKKSPKGGKKSPKGKK